MAEQPDIPPRTPDEELLEAPRDIVTDQFRVRRMRRELEMGFQELADVERAIVVFGSARTPADHPEYALACRVAHALGEAGFAIITGAGGGIMAAANRGAREAGARSIGLGIDLPFAEPENPWIDEPVRFHYFFTRKVMFVRYASAFVVFPGGYGTLDEMFEALTLMQTRKIRSFPLVLVGSDYWTGLVGWLRDRATAEGKISAAELELIEITDDPAEVVRIVSAAAARSATELPDGADQAAGYDQG